MGTQEVKLECAGEKSAVDNSDPVCSFIHHIIHNHLHPKSSGRVTHDSHKLQTKAINHSTRRYMNHRELQSDQPIHIPLLRVLSFPPSDGISTLARQRAPHLATTRKDNTSCNVRTCTVHVLRCYSYTETTCNRQNRYSEYKVVQAATRV